MVMLKEWLLDFPSVEFCSMVEAVISLVSPVEGALCLLCSNGLGVLAPMVSPSRVGNWW